MFSELNRPFTHILSTRLDEAEEKIRRLDHAVKQEYLAAVTAIMNEALAAGNSVSRKIPVVRHAPARPEQVEGNFSILAKDLARIGGQIRLAYEESIRLYNEFAGVQTTLRRRLRSSLYASGSLNWSLSFLDPALLDGTECYLDSISGFAALPATSVRTVVPSQVRLGLGCEGRPAAGFSLESVLDGQPHTALVWSGARLELVFEFAAPTPVNGIALDVVSGDGLVVEDILSTPDEANEESWLLDFPGGATALDGSAAKFSGDWLYLCRPRFVRRVRLILTDRFGTDPIRVTDIRFLQYAFRQQGMLDTVRIDGFYGQARLEADEFNVPRMLQISHWISHDGATYEPVQPGQTVRIKPEGFWYRAQFLRSDSAFQTTVQDIVLPGYDAAGEPVMPERMHSMDLGGGLIERTLEYSSLQGELTFQEALLPGSVSIKHGNLPLPESQWFLLGSTLRISGVLSSGVEIRYKTHSYAKSLQPKLAQFATPILYGVRLVF